MLGEVQGGSRRGKSTDDVLLMIERLLSILRVKKDMFYGHREGL